MSDPVTAAAAAAVATDAPAATATATAAVPAAPEVSAPLASEGATASGAATDAPAPAPTPAAAAAAAAADPTDASASKRGRVAEEGEDDDDSGDDDKGDQPGGARKRDYPKAKKAALLFGYCGTGYQGMQRNPGARTIEEELITALVKANTIRAEDAPKMQRLQFQRAARTDKGVHAAGQVCSLKLRIFDDICERINAHLPESIRIFAVIRATAGFNSKSWCAGRLYEYLCPTYAFTPIDQEPNRMYRITPEQIEAINKVLSEFVGTHNYHNFTSGKTFKDPSSKRFIKSFTCSQPFVRNGIEFVSMKVHGQSFVLNQIRKMIGMTIAIISGHAPEGSLARSLGPDRMEVPRAPGLGLLLDTVYFDKYNSTYAGKKHQSLVWDKYTTVIEAFKEAHIYSNIIQTERNEKEILNWVKALKSHRYEIVVGADGQPARSKDDEGGEDDE